MKIGFVGSGLLATLVLPQMDIVPGYDKIAICDLPVMLPKLEELKEKHNFKKIYTDYELLLKDEEVDTVYVAVVNSMHYEYAKKALLAGKHVICEKPFTLNLCEAEELVSLAKERKLFLFEAITIKYLPAYISLKENLSKLGKIKAVVINMSQYSSRYDKFKAGETPNVFNPNLGGGALEDLNIYNIHFCYGLFGKPNSIEYYGNIIRNVDVSGTLLMHYDDFTINSIGAKNSSIGTGIIIQGENGVVTIEGASYQVTCYNMITGESDYTFHEENEQHRMYHEQVAMAKMFNDGDLEKCYAGLQQTLDVVEISEKARKLTGLKY